VPPRPVEGRDGRCGKSRASRELAVKAGRGEGWEGPSGHTREEPAVGWNSEHPSSLRSCTGGIFVSGTDLVTAVAVGVSPKAVGAEGA